MEPSRIDLPKPSGHHCFACGTDNPSGLHLSFYASHDRVCTDITLDRYRVGWEGIAHGGILSTLLDEIMSWTILYFRKVFFVTRKMEVRYLKPVPVETPLTVCGRMGGVLKPPRIEVTAEIREREGACLARSKGEFVQLDERKISLIPPGLRADMEQLFERFSEL